MSRKVQIVLGVSVILMLSLAVVSANYTRPENRPFEALINCDIQNLSCTQKLGERTISLDIQPKPVKAMENLTFQVRISGPPLVAKPHLDLSMPGMNMGPNWVFLKSRSPGSYEGIGQIVRCPTGKTVWQATVTLPETGTVNYIFDVIY